MKQGFMLIAAVLATALLVFGCVSARVSDYEAGPEAFTLQLLHFADVDGNEEVALASVDEFSALVDAFSNDGEFGASTLLVSSGDNIIPGPRFYAAEQGAVRAVTGSNEPGHTDIAFMNMMGVKASAMGNHDLDAGTGEFADAIQIESKNGVEFPGSLFPYLSSNLDWSTDREMEAKMGENGANVDALAGKVASYATVEVNGETIGLVGASTPLLDTITSTGSLAVLPADRSVESLAAIIQESVDALEAQGVNKIVLLAHMQQIQVEMQLAEMLTGVDIIVAGGSNTRMGDSDDTLFDGDDAFAMSYPYETADADNKPILVVNVDGDYKYLGRLVIPFDAEGYIIRSAIKENKALNGSWAATAQNVETVGGTPIPGVVELRDAIDGVISAQYGNVVGYTNVYLDGRRSQVRTQETNLGNLSADANLWYANQLSEVAVDVSIKNGGGIRTEIGSAVVPPGAVDYSEAVYNPPKANAEAGTQEGAISEGHLRATMRFDNGLVTLSATAAELRMLLEHGVSETAEGKTPGKFPQIAGMNFVFDAALPAGERITSLVVTGADGSMNDVVVADGALVGDASRTFRLVTLNFLANGGDDYPFAELSNPERRNLYEGAGYGEEVDYDDEVLANDPGLNSSFSKTGGEQDALAEYLMTFHATPETAFSQEEAPRAEDQRIRY
ncbi:MAG: bifunctional metallophosphatase/5'-nucleotidase [Spirochaetales bacterium]|nr:bifunctional metallophosphatase/5'-nucleotidase [Spirochaetales bacterium]